MDSVIQGKLCQFSEELKITFSDLGLINETGYILFLLVLFFIFLQFSGIWIQDG